MKKIILLGLLTLLSVSGLRSQWISQPLGVISSLKYLEVESTDVCYILDTENRLIWKTTTGGTAWFSVNPPNYGVFKSFQFINQNTGFISASLMAGIYDLVRTTNGGNNWSFIMQDIYYVSFINNTTGFGTGSLQFLYKTTNTGLNWFQAGTFPDYSYIPLFINELTGVLRNSQAVIKTTNGGTNWTNIYNGLAIDVQCPETSVFFMIKNSSPTYYIARSTNGGANWINQYQTNTPLNKLHFYNSLTGWAAGSSGLILHTTNGGLSWTNQGSGTTKNLLNIGFSGKYIGWASGDNGTVLKTINGGSINVQNVSTEIPSAFSLSQNYPNPFNPETKIRFSIPSWEGYGDSRGVGLVTLKVYDITGKEIAILVNESLQPGTYETTFDASRITSGVYFCRLSSANYSESIRMLLIK